MTLDGSGNVVAYDIETQCRAVFENVRLVLEDAGASWSDIVDVTVFLTHMKKDFPTYNKLYAEYFAGEGKPNPTRTTVEVTALPTPIAIELKVIAAICAGSKPRSIKCATLGRDHARLAAAGARQHEQRAIEVSHRGALRFVERKIHE